MLEIHDSIYRGREDFVYRITVGELPFVTSIFPLGGPAGARTTVELKGWNLPAAKLIEDDQRQAAGRLSALRAQRRSWISNACRSPWTRCRKCLEKEPNNRQANAQRVKLPVIVNGRIDQPGDWDVFRFEGRAGEEIVAEVFARRLGFAAGFRAQADRRRRPATGLQRRSRGQGRGPEHAPRRFLPALKLPADGDLLPAPGRRPAQGRPGVRLPPAHQPPRPDFALRVVPSSINVRAGATVPLTVYALRRDGFAGEIALQVEGCARGLHLSGGVMPARAGQVRLTLTVPPTPRDAAHRLALEGRATIDGHEVRPRRPCPPKT